MQLFRPLTHGLFALLAGLVAGHAQATTISLAPGSWYDFNVDDLLAPATSPLGWIDYSDNSLLTFDFTIGAGQFGVLTVVDAVTAGDRFNVLANGVLLGTTTLVGTSSANVGYDYAAALQNPAFSRGLYTLAAGSYSVTGVMLANPDSINITQGGLRLDVSPIPEASTVALWLLGLSALSLWTRRHPA